MKRILKKIIKIILNLLPLKILKFLAIKFFSVYVEKLNKEQKIRFLLDFDNFLYALQGRASVEYGNGIHSKHRHIKYHDFFVSNIKKDEKVLDIGCGLGVLANAIATRTECSKVYGVEISEKNLFFAKNNYKNNKLEFVLGDATKINFSEKFDVVVLSNVLEHLKNRSEFLASIKKNIQPDRFLIRVPLYERDWRVPLKDELGINYFLDPTHELEYTTEIFEDELDSAGLKMQSAIYKWGELWAVVK